MKLTPRLLVAESVVTDVDKGEQRLELLLLDREASRELPRRFPRGQERDICAMLEYASKRVNDFCMRAAMFP